MFTGSACVAFVGFVVQPCQIGDRALEQHSRVALFSEFAIRAAAKVCGPATGLLPQVNL